MYSTGETYFRYYVDTLHTFVLSHRYVIKPYVYNFKKSFGSRVMGPWTEGQLESYFLIQTMTSNAYPISGIKVGCSLTYLGGICNPLNHHQESSP